MEEIWKDITGFEGKYQVSNMGRVKSIERTRWNGKVLAKVEEKILKLGIDKGGYLHVCLSKDGNKKIYIVHRLVLMTFNPVENMENLEVNHIDENKENNIINNLEWCNRKYNINYGNRNKKVSESMKDENAPWYGKVGVKHNKSIPVVQLTLNGELVNVYGSSNEAEKNGFAHGAITNCIKGKLKTHGGYKWEYLYKYLLLKYPKITKLNLFGKHYNREEVKN